MDEAPIERDSMELDVVIVGAGPSGLAAAVRRCGDAVVRERDPGLSVR